MFHMRSTPGDTGLPSFPDGQNGVGILRWHRPHPVGGASGRGRQASPVEVDGTPLWAWRSWWSRSLTTRRGLSCKSPGVGRPLLCPLASQRWYLIGLRDALGWARLVSPFWVMCCFAQRVRAWSQSLRALSSYGTH